MHLVFYGHRIYFIASLHLNLIHPSQISEGGKNILSILAYPYLVSRRWRPWSIDDKRCPALVRCFPRRICVIHFKLHQY